MKRTGTRLLALLLVCVLLPAAALPEGRAYTVGDKGQEVLQIKQRLKDLRYYTAKTLNKKYTEDTAEVVRQFQRGNGLPETGVVDDATWDALFSEDAVPAPRPTLKPLSSPDPSVEIPWPERDADGYLAGEGEFIFEDDTAGVWVYLGQRLQVFITRRTDKSIPLTWFETEVITRDGEAFRTVETDPDHPGKTFRYPYVIARDEKFVLAFSDDFYGNRMVKKETVGIIVREGRILSTATNSRNGHHLPNLDMMAQFPDGTLQVYRCNEMNAEELTALGAVNVYSFGPILIRDGEINDLVYQYYKSVEPRHALGMIAPNHYLLVSVQGRTAASKGTTLQRVAELMRSRGVVQALNLDGGNTMALVFCGRMLNKLATYKKQKFVRTVTSLIGIGRTDSQEH